jgi:hypothetical protein
MFDQLCTDLPWAQRLSEVWRLRGPEERTASLALHNGGPKPLRRAIDWYHRHDRPRCGDPVTMAHDALQAYRADIAAGKDALLISDSWEMCDALNKQIPADRVPEDAQTVTGARDHRIGVDDIVVTRENNARTTVWAARDDHGRVDTNKPAGQVRNGQRWMVEAIDTGQQRPRIVARRLSDNAVTVFAGDYLRAHVHHGYAVTLQSAQGATADTCYPIIRATTDRTTLYVGLTRGRELNRAYIYERISGEGDHEHADPILGVQQARRGDSNETATLIRAITRRDNRPQSIHQVAAQADRDNLPDRVAWLATKRDHDLAGRRGAYRAWTDQRVTEDVNQNRWMRDYVGRASDQAHTQERSRDTGYDIGL